MRGQGMSEPINRQVNTALENCLVFILKWALTLLILWIGALVYRAVASEENLRAVERNLHRGVQDLTPRRIATLYSEQMDALTSPDRPEPEQVRANPDYTKCLVPPTFMVEGKPVTAPTPCDEEADRQACLEKRCFTKVEEKMFEEARRDYMRRQGNQAIVMPLFAVVGLLFKLLFDFSWASFATLIPLLIGITGAVYLFSRLKNPHVFVSIALMPLTAVLIACLSAVPIAFLLDRVADLIGAAAAVAGFLTLALGVLGGLPRDLLRKVTENQRDKYLDVSLEKVCRSVVRRAMSLLAG